MQDEKKHNLKNEKKNKHLTLDDRIGIQEGLYNGKTFKAIAKEIGKDQTTVSNEVKLHAKAHKNGYVRTDECCPNLLKAPFVCNGCSKRSTSSCSYMRRLYQAKSAQAEYEQTLVESREGIPLNKEEFYKTEKIISDAVISGQHIYHTIQANNLTVSKSTVYRHIEQGYYTISKIDLPWAVKFSLERNKNLNMCPKALKKAVVLKISFSIWKTIQARYMWRWIPLSAELVANSS